MALEGFPGLLATLGKAFGTLAETRFVAGGPPGINGLTVNWLGPKGSTPGPGIKGGLDKVPGDVAVRANGLMVGALASKGRSPAGGVCAFASDGLPGRAGLTFAREPYRLCVWLDGEVAPLCLLARFIRL